MIINHNLSAMNAYNRSKNNNINASKAMEKLSTGLSINRAGDNAAGLSISEKMRAQIRGLQQAERNIQDGVSFLQTAEGALGEIENPNLQRMRELVVQAGNDTLTKEDRDIIQQEIDEIKKSIDGIANYTEFNGIKPLSPPSIKEPPKWTPGNADIVFIIDRTGSMGSAIEKVKSNIDGFVNRLNSNGVDVKLGLVTYGEVNSGEPIIKKEFTDDLNTFKANLNSISVYGGGDYYESGLEGIADPNNGAITYSFRDEAPKHFILVTDAPVHDNNADLDGGDNLSTLDIDGVANDLKSRGVKLTVVSNTYGETNTQLKRLSDTTGGDYLDISGNFGTQLDALAGKIMIDAGAEYDSEDMPTITLQVGPNSKEVFKVELYDTRTFKIGLSDVQVDPIEEVQKALSNIDNTIDLISGRRAKYGSYVNALEHINNNVSNYSLNLEAANSRILDTDMAKETINLSKTSIMQEASSAMLKQANNLPNGVLELLRKE